LVGPTLRHRVTPIERFSVPRGPQALVVAPSQELAMQIVRIARELMAAQRPEWRHLVQQARTRGS
jgi:hypothetical protein